MWSSIFVLFLAIEGSLALLQTGIFQECDGSKCEHVSPGKIFAQLGGLPPNEDQLANICPAILERFACEDEAIKECTGKGLQEWASSDNTTVAAFSSLIVKIENIIIDLCDVDSVLHQGYVSSVTCFNGMIQAPNPKCRHEGVAVYLAYRESMKLLGREIDPIREAAEGQCLTKAYTVACFSIQLQEQCGSVARATFVEILRRLQFLKLTDCSEDDINVLRTTYLEFIEVEEEQKGWFSEVFNTRRK